MSLTSNGIGVLDEGAIPSTSTMDTLDTGHISALRSYVMLAWLRD